MIFNLKTYVFTVPAAQVLNIHPFDVVSRYRDPQHQVSENYSYYFNL